MMGSIKDTTKNQPGMLACTDIASQKMRASQPERQVNTLTNFFSRYCTVLRRCDINRCLIVRWMLRKGIIQTIHRHQNDIFVMYNNKMMGINAETTFPFEGHATKYSSKGLGVL